MESNHNTPTQKSVSLVLVLSPLMNQLLIEASAKAKRSKAKEAMSILKEHLLCLKDETTPGP
jgi:hypothetical protein